jgi:hypothetical protein
MRRVVRVVVAAMRRHGLRVMADVTVAAMGDVSCATDVAVATRPAKRTMSETPPDRLSVNPRSPHYDEAVLARGVGIRFNGQEKTNVEEYCVTEGWVRVAAGRARDRRGDPITLKLTGTVEPYFHGLPEAP